MAKVPVLDPSQVVEPAQARPDYFRLTTPTATPDTFGAQAGAATERLGQQLQSTGAMIGERVNASQQIANESAARDASTNAIQDLTKNLSDYETKKGQDAVNGFDDFNHGIRSTIDNYVGQMQNPVARNMLQAQLARIQTAMFESGARHRSTELNAWTIHSHEGQAQTFADQAVNFRADPDKVDAFITNGSNEVTGLAQVYGWDEATTQAKIQQYRGKAYKSVVESLALDDPLKAQAMFDRTRNLMDAESQVRVAEFLKSRVEKGADDAFMSSVIHTGHVITQSSDIDQVMTAVYYHESRGNQTKPDGTPLYSKKFEAAGDLADAPVGISQIRPSTAQEVAKRFGIAWNPEALKTDRNYNAMLGKFYMQTLREKYQGDNTLAVAAYDAGPGAVDNWIEKFGDPRTGAISYQDWIAKLPVQETRDYLNDVGGSTAGAQGYPPPQPARLTREEAIKRASESSADPTIALRRMSKVNEYYSLLDHQDAQFKADVDRKVSDMAPAALAGEAVTIPEADIRKAYAKDPPRAEQVISNLKLDQQAGQLFAQMKYASPSDRQQIMQDLLSGTGMFNNVLKGKAAQFINGTLVGTDPAAPEGADFHTRNAVMQRFLALDAAQREALDPHKGDPVSYVMGMPGVKTAYDAAHAQGAQQDAFQSYAQAVIAAQVHMGVPEELAQVLPKAEITTLAEQFSKQDPEKRDNSPAMQAMAKGFGPYWPQVYRQLVTQGKLPKDAQSIAWLDAPGQDGARNDFTRAMQFAGAEGIKKLREEAPPDASKYIRQNIDSVLNDVRSTILSPGRDSQGNAAFSNLRDTVEMVALYRAMRTGSANGTDELKSAVDDVVNAKWDLARTYRTPKGMLSQAEQVASRLQNGLKPEDIKREEGNRDLTDDQWRHVVSNSPMAWVNNSAGDGLYLVQQRRDGQWAPLHTAKTGERVEFKFADMAKLGAQTNAVTVPQVPAAFQAVP